MGIETKEKRELNIYEQIKKSLYNWIMHNPQVVQSPIFNDCLKVKIYCHTELQLVPKLLWHVSLKEIHNNLVSATKYGGLK